MMDDRWGVCPISKCQYRRKNCDYSLPDEKCPVYKYMEERINLMNKEKVEDGFSQTNVISINQREGVIVIPFPELVKFTINPKETPTSLPINGYRKYHFVIEGDCDYTYAFGRNVKL